MHREFSSAQIIPTMQTKLFHSAYAFYTIKSRYDGHFGFKLDEIWKEEIAFIYSFFRSLCES
jgi:hypothetical protein